MPSGRASLAGGQYGGRAGAVRVGGPCGACPVPAHPAGMGGGERASLTPGTLVTDVTGVKGGIVDRMQALMPEGVEFIAAHPMAGREKCGVQHSDDSVFRGANYIVVPTDRNTPEAIALCVRLGELLGFHRISRLSVGEHDRMIAFLSQLTHCIAVALMCANDQPGLEAFTATPSATDADCAHQRRDVERAVPVQPGRSAGGDGSLQRGV